jgi:hypothetical protein
MNLIGSKHVGFKKQKKIEVWWNRYPIDNFPVKMITVQSIVIVFSRSLKDESNSRSLGYKHSRGSLS